jgi:hypothetical protein
MNEPDESLERERYEISNAMEKCPNCFARLIEEADYGRMLVVCPVCRTIVKEVFES